MKKVSATPEVEPTAHRVEKDLLQLVCDLSAGFFDGLRERPVGRPVDPSALLARLGGKLPTDGEDPLQVVRHLAEVADPGIVATAGPRYFGFVTGGSVPAAIAADWLTSAWDQNAFTYVMAPAAKMAEEVVRQWLTELLGLSTDMSLGLVTGATMANFTCLAAARHALLGARGWNVEEKGLFGAPEFTVITSDESHITVFVALQMLGLGRQRVLRVATDEQGRMRASELQALLPKIASPALVCAQAGNVNTGAFDPIAEIAQLVHQHGSCLHVDGAFGTWAAASPSLRHLASGIEQADSIAVDGHKWLNVPYDSGMAFVRDSRAHAAAMTLNAPYYGPATDVARQNQNRAPESSRRARSFAIYAALRSLGRNGVSALMERSCRQARRMAERLSGDSRAKILNDVVLNQVLVRFSPKVRGDADSFTAEVIRRVQQDGTCWAGGTNWHGVHAMRISICNWSTTEADVERSAEAILRCVDAAEG